MAIDSTTPTTIAGKTETTGKTAGKSNPGRRTQNPLSKFSNYTYQLSLYMITPNAYETFIASGRRDLSAVYNTRNQSTNNPAYPDGAYLVAQSGGFGDNRNSTSNTNNLNVRIAPGMENLALSLDNLKMTSFLAGKATQEASNVTNFSFTIYEPYGFSFITRLNEAMNVLSRSSNGKMPNNTSAFRQFFILGIRFQGYDKNGNIITGEEFFANDTKNPVGNSSGVFERFFDILITRVKFNLDGRASTYSVTATPVNGRANSVTLGRIKNKITLEGATVGDMLNSLKTQLNEMDKVAKQNFKDIRPNTYNFEFTEETQRDLLSAKIKDDDKGRAPASNAENSRDVSARDEARATYNSTIKKIEIAKDTTILQAIQQIVKQSEFYISRLTVEANSEPPQAATNAYPVENTNSNLILNNYNVGSKILPKQFNEQFNDWAYEITYLIQIYRTPAIDTVYVEKNNLEKYYGPHKRYEYWFTGENTEIIGLDFDYNYLYYTTAVADFPITRSFRLGDVPIQPNMQDNQSRINSLNYGFGPQNSYLTSLYDPATYISLRMRILGDPDFLMFDSPTTLTEPYDKFYAPDGFTINPNGGQVFAEISFNEGIDYDWAEGNEGLFLINESIIFWDYPKDLNIKGISFYVQRVTSSFEGGKFTQDLLMNINNIRDTSNDSLTQREPEANPNNRTGNNNNNSNNGTRREPPPVLEGNEPSVASATTVTNTPNNIPPAVQPEGRDLSTPETRTLLAQSRRRTPFA